MSTALETTAAHAERLAAAFGGSVEGWEYTGEITEGDPATTKCPCGHAIRNMFWWQHEDGRKLFTGSVCVETLPGLTAGTMDAMRGSIAALESARRKASNEAKVAAARERVTARIAADLAPFAEERRDGRQTYRAAFAASHIGSIDNMLREAARLVSAPAVVKRLAKIEAAVDRRAAHLRAMV